MDPAVQFYREQLKRFLWPAWVILALDFLVLFVLTELPWPAFVAVVMPVRAPLVAALSGSLGGFVRFLVADPIPFEKLSDTAHMFRYWVSLVVGAVLGFFSYLLLMDARLLKLVYPTLPLEPSIMPSAVSAAILGGLVGLLAKEIVAAGQKRFTSGSKQDSSDPLSK